MLMPRDISIEQMDPFVRYVHVYSVGYDTPFQNIVPYDCRCIYIIEGEGSIKLDGHDHPVRPGSLFIWQAGLTYGYAPLSDRPFTALGINFDYTQACSSIFAPVAPVPAADYRYENLLSPVHIQDYEPFNHVVALQGLYWIKDTMLQMEREYRTRRIYYNQRLRGQMLCLLCDVARIHCAADQQSSDICDTLLDYIHAHYRKQMTNEALSRIFNFHPAYLSRLLKCQTGMPLHRYLIHYRLSVAQNLLLTTMLPIREVAEQSGFSDTNYFTRCFKRHWGKCPGEFRPGH